MADISVLNFGDGVNRNIKDVTSRVLLPSTVGWTGKNLLPNTVESRTVNDLVVTHNNDGTVTVDGTASAETWITIYRDFNSSSVQYELSGCVGGSNSTYFQILVVRNSGDTADETYYQDFGTGVKFTPPQGRRCPVYIVVKNGQQLDNVVFSPMLRDSRITDPTYEPYHKSVEECLEEINDKLSYLETTATLSTSAATTVTFTSAKLTTSSCVEVGVSEWGLVPDDVTVSTGSCTVTLPIVDSAHTVTVRLYVR